MLGPAPVGADLGVTGVTVTQTSSQVRVHHLHQVRPGLAVSRVLVGGIILIIVLIKLINIEYSRKYKGVFSCEKGIKLTHNGDS